MGCFDCVDITFRCIFQVRMQKFEICFFHLFGCRHILVVSYIELDHDYRLGKLSSPNSLKWITHSFLSGNGTRRPPSQKKVVSTCLYFPNMSFLTHRCRYLLNTWRIIPVRKWLVTLHLQAMKRPFGRETTWWMILPAGVNKNRLPFVWRGTETWLPKCMMISRDFPYINSLDLLKNECIFNGLDNHGTSALLTTIWENMCLLFLSILRWSIWFNLMVECFEFGVLKHRTSLGLNFPHKHPQARGYTFSCTGGILVRLHEVRRC